eukprot:614956-Amphidinium_carterae.1
MFRAKTAIIESRPVHLCQVEATTLDCEVTGWSEWTACNRCYASLGGVKRDGHSIQLRRK